MSFFDINIFHLENIIFIISQIIDKNKGKNCILISKISVLKGYFIQHECNFDYVSKIVTADPLKTNYIFKKDYDIIIYAHAITNKILSRDSGYFADMVT